MCYCVVSNSLLYCRVDSIYVCLFRRVKIFVDFVGFLSTIIYGVLYSCIIMMFKAYLQHLVFRY